MVRPNYRDFRRLSLLHSAKGSSWDEHKYIKRLDGVYYYPDSYEGGRHLPKSGTSGIREAVKSDGPLSDDELENLAKEVISGKYGNGSQRRELLGGYYEQVQARVNQILKGETASTSSSQTSESPATKAESEIKKASSKSEKETSKKKEKESEKLVPVAEEIGKPISPNIDTKTSEKSTSTSSSSSGRSSRRSGTSYKSTSASSNVSEPANSTELRNDIEGLVKSSEISNMILDSTKGTELVNSLDELLKNSKSLSNILESEAILQSNINGAKPTIKELSTSENTRLVSELLRTSIGSRKISEGTTVFTKDVEKALRELIRK